jgi:hypothetical protein
MGLDTKTYWLTDRQSQCDLDLDLADRTTEPVAITVKGRVVEAERNK